MSPLTVALPAGADDRFAGAQRAAWATLPMSLTAVAGQGADLVVVDGTADGWLDGLEAQVGSGVAGVLLVRPRPGPAGAEVRRVDRAARDAGIEVVVDRGWAAHPAIGALTPAGPVGEPALADCLVTVPPDDGRSSSALLLEQLALVRSVLGPVARLEFAAGDRHGYTVDGRRGGCIVALSAVRSSGPARARLTAYAASGEVHVEVGDDGTAAPATVWRVDAQGLAVEPTRYESGVRACWLRLVSRVRPTGSDGPAPGPAGDLAALADDLDLLATTTTLES